VHLLGGSVDPHTLLSTLSPLTHLNNAVVASAVKAGSNDDLKFLGLLQPSGESYLYGYITSSGIKLIVVIKGTLPKEQDVRALFHKLHTGYTMLVRNPFYKPGSDINSSSFDTVVRSVMPATTTTA
jgi:hypothetical protein